MTCSTCFDQPGKRGEELLDGELCLELLDRLALGEGNERHQLRMLLVVQELLLLPQVEHSLIDDPLKCISGDRAKRRQAQAQRFAGALAQPGIVSHVACSPHPRGPASRTSGLTCAAYLAKFSANSFASFFACWSYAAGSGHVCRGRSTSAGTPGQLSGTCRPKTGSAVNATPSSRRSST